MNRNSKIYSLVLTALFLALGFALPKVFHLFAMGGQIFLPMHIPVLLCGFICGWQYGLGLGLVLPILSSVLTGMPVFYPMAIIMTGELAVYGLVAGYLYRKNVGIFPSLISAMVLGRVVSGILNFALLTASGKGFVLAGFLTGAFVTALPGIVVQLVAIPFIVAVLKKQNLIHQ